MVCYRTLLDDSLDRVPINYERVSNTLMLIEFVLQHNYQNIVPAYYLGCCNLLRLFRVLSFTTVKNKATLTKITHSFTIIPDPHGLAGSLGCWSPFLTSSAFSRRVGEDCACLKPALPLLTSFPRRVKTSKSSGLIRH